MRLTTKFPDFSLKFHIWMIIFLSYFRRISLKFRNFLGGIFFEWEFWIEIWDWFFVKSYYVVSYGLFSYWLDFLGWGCSGCTRPAAATPNHFCPRAVHSTKILQRTKPNTLCTLNLIWPPMSQIPTQCSPTIHAKKSLFN